MKIDIKLLAFIGIAILVTYGITRWMHGQDVIISREYPEEKIDSVTTVYKNRIDKRESIIDSIRVKNENLADRIEQQKDQIASFTSLEGQLRTKIDSLQNHPDKIDLPGLISEDTMKVFRDTSFTNIRTFGDSLFSVKGTVNIKQDSLWQELGMDQIRPINIDVAVTVSDDKRSVKTYITSKDFVNFNRTNATTQLRPEEKFPWHWVTLGAGFVGGILIAK